MCMGCFHSYFLPVSHFLLIVVLSAFICVPFIKFCMHGRPCWPPLHPSGSQDFFFLRRNPAPAAGVSTPPPVGRAWKRSGVDAVTCRKVSLLSRRLKEGVCHPEYHGHHEPRLNPFFNQICKALPGFLCHGPPPIISPCPV